MKSTNTVLARFADRGLHMEEVRTAIMEAIRKSKVFNLNEIDIRPCIFNVEVFLRERHNGIIHRECKFKVFKYMPVAKIKQIVTVSCRNF